jgi:hypothetical protein
MQKFKKTVVIGFVGSTLDQGKNLIAGNAGVPP